MPKKWRRFLMEQVGRVVQIIGPVVDCEFEEKHLPPVYNCVIIEGETSGGKLHVSTEVQQHLGEGRVRCVSLQPTEGMVRGMTALDTGGPISIPVGRETLGRVINVIGQPVDQLGELKASKSYPIHRPAPAFDEQSTEITMLETGIKVIDLLEPYVRGGKIGLFGGAGVGKTYAMLEAAQSRKAEGVDVRFYDIIYNLVEDIDKALKKNKIKAVIVFEKDFGRQLISEGKATVSIIADGSEPNMATLITNYITAIVSDFNRELADPSVTRTLPVQREIRGSHLEPCCSFFPAVAAEYAFLDSPIRKNKLIEVIKGRAETRLDVVAESHRQVSCATAGEISDGDIQRD
jgi:F0F1-type ATP synthase alpha subunit